jgi:hypothetical protein
MDTSVAETEGEENQSSVEDQSAPHSQEVKKSESKTEAATQVKATKVPFRSQVKVGAGIIRGFTTEGIYC